MVNIQIEQFRLKLRNLINQSQLPIGVVKLILSEASSEINNLYEQILQQEYTDSIKTDSDETATEENTSQDKEN